MIGLQNKCYKYLICDRIRNLLEMKIFVGFYCEEIINIDFDEDSSNKIISQIFMGVINLPIA